MINAATRASFEPNCVTMTEKSSEGKVWLIQFFSHLPMGKQKTIPATKAIQVMPPITGSLENGMIDGVRFKPIKARK